MKQLIYLSANDFKLIFRDPTLRVFMALPILLIAIAYWFLPYLEEQYDFMAPYISIIMVLLIIENTQSFSFIYTIVFVEEKESEVAKVYGVLPVSKKGFVLSRLVFPYIITVIFNLILLGTEPFYNLSFTINLFLSMLAALVVPLYVLSISTYVENKIKAMIYVKLWNMILLIPMAAFFVPSGYKHIFGFIPTHWFFQGVHNIFNQEEFIAYLLTSAVFIVVLTIYYTNQFVKTHFN